MTAGNAARRRRGPQEPVVDDGDGHDGQQQQGKDVGNVVQHRQSFALLAPNLQHGQKCFLGDLDRPDLFHAFLALFLLFQQLALARRSPP